MAAYLVIGAHRVGGCEPGETVEIENDEDARRLVAGGHIESKTKPKTPNKGEKEQEK